MEHLDERVSPLIFQKIICGDMVEQASPAPGYLSEGCEELGVAPGQALAVEDSFNGIRSACAAGLYIGDGAGPAAAHRRDSCAGR